jgi:HK97 family phage major capsid protein
VSLPTRSATPTVAGSFVGEGAPIPVRKAGFTSITLTPKKMAVITAMTREITERSTPQIEQLLRNAIQEDTAVAIDSVLLDATAASTIRPAGLRNGITTAAGTAGGGIAAVVADLKGMLGTLNTATNGNLRNLVFLMNPAQAIALSLTQNAGGDFPFAQEINQNRFQGYDVIQSTTVPAGVVIALDAADFFSATGDEPRFEVSDQATLHMEDTTPLAIGTAGAPNTVAAPVQSMFQTDSLALRMILPMNWAMRRPVAVERTAVTW